MEQRKLEKEIERLKEVEEEKKKMFMEEQQRQRETNLSRFSRNIDENIKIGSYLIYIILNLSLYLYSIIYIYCRKR